MENNNAMQQGATKRNINGRQHASLADMPPVPITTIGVSELAVIFRCSEGTIRTLSSRDPKKLPPAIVIGRKKFWLHETVLDWLLERQERPNAD